MHVVKSRDNFLSVVISEDNTAVIQLVNDECLFFVLQKAHFSEETWRNLRDFYKKQRESLPKYKALVISDGGGPTGTMRREYQADYGAHTKNSRTVIISDSLMTRFLVSGLSLFTSYVRGYESANITSGVEFLEVSKPTREIISKVFQSMKPRVPSEFATFHKINADKLSV